MMASPESFGFFLACANYRLCYLNLAGITNFNVKGKTKRILVVVVKMTPSCKWPIAMPLKYKKYPYKRLSLYRHRILQCELFNREE